MKKILILGSTGSIGTSALEVISEFRDEFKVVGLTVNKNIDLIEKQINEFGPEAVCVKDELKAKDLKKRIGSKCKIFEGANGLIELSSTIDYDILLSSLVGFAGLAPTLEAIKRGKRIALANKETLVAAGELVIEMCKKYGSQIIPVDSEHSAVFQCLSGENKQHVKKLILTASGGPFLNKNINELSSVTIDAALNHPNWKMGNKITIDSATMMNKGLEVIEAHWLFNLEKGKIEVLIHPQSIIHSMVEFVDGSIKAQLSKPDMRIPILYALTYPERYTFNQINTDLKKIHELTFFEPDFNKFECLKLAYDVMDEGGTKPCIMNAANEVAVHNFLSGKMNFLQIPVLIKDALNKIEAKKITDLETIFECDIKTREYLQKKYN
ncbi:1-deoxy-D-xylulose-5-phosphate reductoisomerase [Melioribacteraceae bacterium 4301-Me]|uniref:1-deoxy-D-xylulose-5-phosphate reductoisomerase n=1 Tax=Pyranulibacter aquaticus TaxID=3163344 RepID=UPI0035992A24